MEGTLSNSPGEPVLRTPITNLAKPKTSVIGKLVGSELCTRGKSPNIVRHVSVDLSGTPLAGQFLPGQSFGVIPPGTNAKGRPHSVRLYSHAGPSWGEDGDGAVVSTPVKRLIEEFKPQRKGDDPDAHHLFLGVCSNYLCDLPLGSEVKVTGPSGRHFLLPEEPDAWDYLFLATGTGIAPFRGMTMELLQGAKRASSRVEVVMGVPYTTDLQCDGLFRELDEAVPDFRYHTAVSREAFPGYGSRGRYVHHLLADEWDHFEPFLKSPRTLIYVCGIGGMEVGLYRLLAERGVHDPYLNVRPLLEGVAPADWESKSIPRGIKTTGRCMVEVY